jgi:ribonuclease R
LAPPRKRRPHRREAFSREQILDFLRAHPGADRRSVARELRLKGDERIALKVLWAQLAAEGLLTPPDAGPKGPLETGAVPDVMLVRIDAIDLESGEALAEPVEWARAGAPPRIRLGRFDSAGLTIGGRALVRIGERGGRVWRARLLRTAPDLPERVVGVVRRSPIGRILEPADKKLRIEFLLADDGQDPPQDGELVVATPLAQRRFEKPRAKIVERLGSEDAPRAASAIALALHEIPVAFSPGSLAQAHDAVPVPMGKREDLRAMKLVTIDGADARDFDDAVFAEPDPDQPDGFRIVVAIADVAWYVGPGTPLDRDAEMRGNSVYFPDRVVPMLPERLSNDLCSMRPEEDRPVMAVEMRIDAAGRLLGHRFMRAMMRSAARLTYERVQAWADGDAAVVLESLHAPLRHLYAAYRALSAARDARGTLDLEMEERAVTLDAQGRIARIAPRARLDAHRLIEEFMILANVAAAEALERRHKPCLYRVHDQPSVERIDGLRESLATLGYRLAKGQVMRPKILGDVLHWAEGKPFQAMVNDLVLRSQALAVYSPENLGHFGLALPRYAHFTSPIRRYADLVVHRALIATFDLGEGGDSQPFERLILVGERVSKAERRAQAAERGAMERYVASFLKPQLGNRFEARISGLHRAGIFVALLDTGAEGLIPMSTLPGRWRLHPAGHNLEGPYPLALADRILVRLAEVVPVTGALRFELDHAPAGEGHGAPRRPGGRKPHGPPRQARRGRRR